MCVGGYLIDRRILKEPFSPFLSVASAAPVANPRSRSTANVRTNVFTSAKTLCLLWKSQTEYQCALQSTVQVACEPVSEPRKAL